MNLDQVSQASNTSLPASLINQPRPTTDSFRRNFGPSGNSRRPFRKPTASSTPTAARTTYPWPKASASTSKPEFESPSKDESTAQMFRGITELIHHQQSTSLANSDLVMKQLLAQGATILAIEAKCDEQAVIIANLTEVVHDQRQINLSDSIGLARSEQNAQLEATMNADVPTYDLRSGQVNRSAINLSINKTPQQVNPPDTNIRNQHLGQGDHIVHGQETRNGNRNNFASRDYNPRFENGLDGYTIKDAKHRSFRLTENHSSIPKFDPATETVGYFLVGKLFPFTESISLPAIQYVDGWLQNALPTVPSIKLNNAKNKARSKVHENDVREYLLRLARLLHGQGRKLSPIAFKRTFQENLSSYAERLMIEFNTVFKQSYDEFHSENELVRDVYYHITCNEEKEIRTSLNQTVKYMRLGNIDSLDKLREITQSVDEILITLDDSNVGIASHQEVSAFTNQHNYKNTTFTNNPYVSPHNSPQEKVKCEGVNNNSCKNMFSTDRGYKKCHECHMKSTWSKCTTCNTDFLAERSTNKRCRDCYYKQRRSQSVDRNSNNSVPQTSNSNERGRPPHRNVPTTAAVEQESTPDDLYVLSGPVFGDELEMNSNDISPETIASVLKRFDCHLLDVQPVSKSRIFIDFSHKSGEKGSCLIDTGANVDTMSEDFCKRANLPINRQESSKVRDYKGDVCATPGKVRTTINIGLVEHSTNYTVISTSLGPDVILGIPFLNRFGLVNSLRTKLTNITGKNTTESISPKN